MDMKAILIKLDLHEGYRLNDEKGNLIASTLDGAITKLSKQNCDEIFGVVDVERLFNEVDETIDFHEFCFTSFKLGFNKAMELVRKDKIAEFEVKNVIPPTEIYVEIEMVEAFYIKVPKLDSEGCLILKRV
jgi:hypothetical protein